MKSKVHSLSDRSVVVAADLDDVEVRVEVVATVNRYLFLEPAFRLGIEPRKDCTCSRFERTGRGNILKKTQSPIEDMAGTSLLAAVLQEATAAARSLAQTSRHEPL